MSHTPGPWIADGTRFVRQAGGERHTICRLPTQYNAADQHLIMAAPNLKAVVENFEIKGPDDDGLLWLVLHGNGTTGKAMFNLGRASSLSAVLAILFELDRRVAIARAESGLT